MINNNSQYLNLDQFYTEKRKTFKIIGITGGLIMGLLSPGGAYADEVVDYTGTWSTYMMSGTTGTGMGTQAIVTDTSTDWSIGYRGESIPGKNNNHTLAGTLHIGEHYILVPTHARTAIKTNKGNIVENNSHLELHHIEEGKPIDHITASLGYGKSTGNGKGNLKFVGEDWTSVALSAGGNLDIGHQHGYIYGTIGKEYITQPHHQDIGFGAVEYHSGKVRSSVFATENKLREYKVEYGNGNGWMAGISHTEGYISNTRAYIGYTLGFGGNHKTESTHHLDTAGLMKQTLFATDITNTPSLAGTKGEFEEEESHGTIHHE